jgi:hypothetical protein
MDGFVSGKLHWIQFELRCIAGSEGGKSRRFAVLQSVADRRGGQRILERSPTPFACLAWLIRASLRLTGMRSSRLSP